MYTKVTKILQTPAGCSAKDPIEVLLIILITFITKDLIQDHSLQPVSCLSSLSRMVSQSSLDFHDFAIFEDHKPVIWVYPMFSMIKTQVIYFGWGIS